MGDHYDAEREKDRANQLPPLSERKSELLREIQAVVDLKKMYDEKHKDLLKKLDKLYR